MPNFPRVACVGMHFRGASAVEIAASLEAGDTVALEREPDNAYDAYAIKILYGEHFIGYVERGQACWISPYLDEGGIATATVLELEQRRKNIHPILSITVE